MRWELPGPRRFLERAASALEQGKHAVLVAPTQVLENWMAIELEKVLRGQSLGEVTYLEVGPETDPDPLCALSLSLGLDKRELISIDDVLEHSAAPSRFLLLRGVDSGDESRQLEWASLLSRAACQTQIAGMSKTQLISLMRPLGCVPPRDLFLAVEYWWGMMGRVDLDWVVEQVLEESPPSRLTGHYWGRALSRGVASWDPDLAALLLRELPTTLEQISDCLLRSSRDYGSPPEQINGVPWCRAVLPGQQPPQPPRNGDALRLWSEGWMDFMKGQGQILHSAVLAGHPGGKEELARRVWSGQQEVLLPVVEQVRMAVLDAARLELGDGWQEAIYGVSFVEEIADKCSEIGTMSHLFSEKEQLRCHDRGRPRRLLLVWKKIRNALAHAKMVEYDLLDDGVDQFQRFLQSVNSML